MKHIKFISTLIIVGFVSTLFADSYRVESDDSSPLYFGFVYEPLPPVKTKIIPKLKPKKVTAKRKNYIKDEIVLLYPTKGVKSTSSIINQYNLKQKSKVSLSSVNRGMIVAKTNGQDPLALKNKINRQQKHISASTNNTFNTASTSFKNAYSMYNTGVNFVHKTTRGKGITICMVDTPVDITHPSLSAAHIETLDLFDYDQINDSALLHGTAVAGILVSQNTHIGIAPQAKLFAIGAFENKSNIIQGSSSNIAIAIDACIQHKVDVINLSFTGSQDKLLEKLVLKAIEKGIIVVAAAGNGGHWGSSIYPALIPGVITATAVDEDERLFSKADKGRFIDFSAPGVDILTIAPGGKYKLATGTSLSSAHVSGIVTLLLSQKRNIDIDTTLTKTAIDLGKPGRDQMYGEGLISASNALNTLNK